MDGDIWDEDAATYWGGPLPKPGQGWASAASTYDGVPQWEPEWKASGKAVDALSTFRELPGHQPNRATLLNGFTRLNVLADKTIRTPPST